MGSSRSHPDLCRCQAIGERGLKGQERDLAVKRFKRNFDCRCDRREPSETLAERVTTNCQNYLTSSRPSWSGRNVQNAQEATVFPVASSNEVSWVSDRMFSRSKSVLP